ncbi:hypothetical protein [Synechococcus sp. MU1625]|uniref:hypothetical protein n=1 Tax=Synechococcus sp. MU1625 TaxID=2508347 RepID=UPI001CF91B64|nr:hypothetical protein [Synechococcus sp. MU1625]MCB4398455.1 hypothetical protein [Synechococcus sp. MU1625]
MNKHLAISIATASIAIGAIPTLAEVDPKIHKLCVEAKDYAGCVRAMRGDTTTTTIREIRSQGADIAEGNQCPAGFAYVGGGNCMEVKCVYNTATGLGFDTGHDPRVAGKSDWKCKYSLWYGAGVMQLQGNARASINAECPSGEPEVGYNSTCQKAPAGWESPSAKAAREKREGPKCDFKLQKYGCSFDTYLEANPGMKKWAELNPDMAAKERIKLQSID